MSTVTLLMDRKIRWVVYFQNANTWPEIQYFLNVSDILF